MIARNSKVALLAFACFAVAAADACAYDCTGPEDEKFTSYSAKIRTIIENRTSDKGFGVTIYRDGEKEADEYLNNANRQMQYTMEGDPKTGDEVFVEVVIHRRDGSSEKISCDYKVSFDATQGVTKWSLLDKADSICGDVTEICKDCGLTCENRYSSNRRRWTTTLAICDFFDKNCSAGAR